MWAFSCSRSTLSSRIQRGAISDEKKRWWWCFWSRFGHDLILCRIQFLAFWKRKSTLISFKVEKNIKNTLVHTTTLLSLEWVFFSFIFYSFGTCIRFWGFFSPEFRHYDDIDLIFIQKYLLLIISRHYLSNHTAFVASWFNFI